MSHLHRNSQRRIYKAGARYFVTSVTFDRYPYFKNPILAELFVRDLWFAAEIKDFDLFGYTVQHDHIHLLFQPNGAPSYSEIMRSLKTNFSRDANDLILTRVDRFQLGVADRIQSGVAGDVAPRHLHHETTPNPVMSYRLRDQSNSPKVSLHQEKFRRHYANVVVPLFERFLKQHPRDQQMPAFKWQKPFRDHYIRGRKDFRNHLEYIFNNAVKHGIVSDPTNYPFVWVHGMPKFVAPD